MNRLRLQLKLFFLVYLALVAFALALVACSDAVTREAARDGYTAQQMDCVKQYDTRQEIDACRDRVKENWGRNARADAGKDGAK